MIFNMTGGGGAELNFTVLGGTSAPANPKENTIWVNTDAEITSWGFLNAPNPSWEMGEGYVYLNAIVSPGGGNDFNILKKNGVWLKLLSASQQVNGVWLKKDVKIFQGGVWKDTRFYLFNHGEKSVGFTNGGNSIDRGATLAVGATSWEKLDGYFRCGPIDVTAFDVLNANIVEGIYGGNLWLGVSDKTSYEWDLDFIAVTSRNSAGEISLDVSSITGSHYIVISFIGEGAANVSEISLGY